MSTQTTLTTILENVTNPTNFTNTTTTTITTTTSTTSTSQPITQQPLTYTFYVGLTLAIASSLFNASGFILKKKGLIKLLGTTNLEPTKKRAG